MRKRRWLTVGLLVISLLAMLTFSACENGIYLVIFSSNDEVYDIVATSDPESITFPAEPERNGYAFGGWFLDKNVWEIPFTAETLMKNPLDGNITAYAKWDIVTCDVCADGDGDGMCDMCGESVLGTRSLTYIRIDDSYAVTGLKDSTATEITVPYLYKGLPVTTINQRAFYFETELTEINLPSTVTHIGAYAFYNCSSITEMEIPEKLESIGDYAFTNCDSLIKITVDAENKTYSDEDGVLYNKDKTKLINYPAGKSEESFTVPSGVKTIADYAFYKSRLSGITLDPSVTDIGVWAFAKCGDLTDIDLPSGINSVGEYAFAFCDRLIEVNFNGNSQLEQLSAGLFYRCAALITLTVPESVTDIGEYAFAYCEVLIGIVIPSAVQSIGGRAFSYCSGLLSITFSAGSSIDTIADELFYQCVRLTGIAIPDTVTSIGNAAFYGCSQITTLDLSSVTDISDSAFSYCEKLTQITLFDGLKTIGKGAFSFCERLTDIELPQGVESMGEGVFSNCDALVIYCKAEKDASGWHNDWNVSDCPVYWQGSGDNFIKQDEVHYLIRGTEAILIRYLKATNVVIPDTVLFDGTDYTVVGIGRNAFFGYNEYLEEDNGLHYAGKWLIGALDRTLTSADVRESTVGIADGAFYQCNRLASLTFAGDSQLTSIGNGAFYRCSQLSGIAIPKGVKYIGESAFLQCTSLADVSFTGDSQLEHIGAYAFDSCKKLINITLPAGVTSIGDNAFYASGLTSIVLSLAVTDIGERAFGNCDGLTVYCEASQQPLGWQNNWNASLRPVILGVNLSGEMYVESVMRKSDSIENQYVQNGISAPYRKGYNFLGWTLTNGGTMIDFAAKAIAEAPVGAILYAVWAIEVHLF